MLKSWVDGKITDRISLGNRGLNYGDGFFTTALVLNSKIKLFSYHLQRIQDSAQRLKLALDIDNFKRDLASFLQDTEFDYKDQILLLKIIITRGDARRGYHWGLNDSIHLVFQLSELLQYEKIQDYRRHGVKVFLCNTRLSNNKMLAGIKHLNRLEQVLARSERNPDHFPEGLMFDQNNYLIEACTSNLFIRRGKQVFTPGLESAGVAGVAREHLISQLKQSSFDFQERDIKLEQLLDADEIILTNAIIGMWPVIEIDGCAWMQNKKESQSTLINSFDLSSFVY